MPPALVVSAGFDPIRDDGLDYSARLRTAGVPVELLHYAGQFHGFLNFDSVIGAGRDALCRIGAALAAVFRGETAADSTIEISDRCPARRGLLAAAGDVAMASVVGCAAAERLGFTLLGRLAPTAASAARWLLESHFVPGAFLRHGVIANKEGLAARQTYPER